MNSPNGALFLMAWNRPWHGMTTAKSPLFLNFFIVNLPCAPRSRLHPHSGGRCRS